MKKIFVAVGLSLLALLAHADPVIRVLALFTPTASYSIRQTVTLATFISNAQTSFNSAVSTSGGGGYSIEVVGDHLGSPPDLGTNIFTSNSSLQAALNLAQKNEWIKIKRDITRADIVVIFDVQDSLGAKCGITYSGAYINPKYAYSIVNAACPGTVYTKAFSHEMGHQFGATAEDGGPTAASFVFKVGTNEDDCQVFYSIMQHGPDAGMIGAGAILYSAFPTHISAGIGKTIPDAVTDMVTNQCPAAAWTEHGLSIDPVFHTYTCEIGSRTPTCTTPSGLSPDFTCDVITHDHQSWAGGSHTWDYEYYLNGGTNYYNRPFTCPTSQTVSTSRFSNATSLFVVPSGYNVGYSGYFGDTGHNAIPKMYFSSLTVKDNHTHKISGIGLLLF